MKDVDNEYYQSGKLKSTVPLSNNMKHGHMKMYYETGELMYEGDWDNNQQCGLWKLYYENGNIKRENIFTMHKKISQKDFSISGNLGS